MSTREIHPRDLSGVAPRRPPLGVVVTQVMLALSLRSNFAWILAGNIVYAVCQWGAIVVLAKLGRSYVVGQFSLGLAIATRAHAYQPSPAGRASDPTPNACHPSGSTFAFARS